MCSWHYACAGSCHSRNFKNIPVKTGVVQFETTTPTGAAILAVNVQSIHSRLIFQLSR